MRLVLKGVATRVSIEDGTTHNTFDFINDEGDPDSILAVPVSPESVQFLMEALGQVEEPAEEPEPPEDEEPPTPPPPPKPPQRAAPGPTFPSARKRLQQGPGADDGVAPL
jgi:hypothetical protein